MLIILLPLLGFILSFFAKYIGKTAATWLSIVSVGLAWLYAMITALLIFGKNLIFVYTIDWLIIENLQLQFKILLDPLSIAMSLLITFITLLVMLYSKGYLKNDPSLVRFLAYFSLFDINMLIMATSGNYVQFFIGWEGVGLTSYLLISFWHARNEANKGALKAIVVNRIGDIFFMFALALMWLNFKSFDFTIIFALFPETINNHIINDFEISNTTMLSLCLVIAACAKSAQFFLHTWLPDAMEGPTPVSSLLHSATMVTAGIFLVIRSSHILSLTPCVSAIMAVIGALTALTSGLMGLMQNDLKRIIAYSTCSQLGFMTMACGLGYYTYAFFHLITHAFFKCLLFLCSGSIIHALNDEQDIRKMGNMFYFIPVTFSCMTIGTLALTGFPFLAGYYSKDLILETAFASASGGIVIYSIATLTAFLTSFYSARLLYLVFFRKTSPITKNNISNIHEAPAFMLIPMITLATLSLLSGYILQPAFTGPLGVFSNAVASPLTISLAEHEYIHISIKLLPTTFGLLGLALGYIYFSSDRVFTLLLQNYMGANLAHQKFYIDLIYNQLLARNTVKIAYLQYTNIDRGLLETLGPYGLGRVVLNLKQFDKLDTAFIPHYIILFVIIILIGMLLGFSKYSVLTIIALGASLFIKNEEENNRKTTKFKKYL